MAQLLTVPNDPCHVVVIVGGAVAGSEAAALCSERGIIAVVLEQNDRPYGKIEDGLPRWHDKLRRKEYEHIDANLQRPGVLFVPRTKLGEDLSLDRITREWGANAVLLASGAWRDRPLFPEADRYLDHGLVNQNALVYWYNHHHEQGYAGPTFEIEDGAVVVGGGLASIDVVKIINFELYKRALAKRGVHTTTLALEHDGIPQFVAAHGLDLASLGVRGVTLYYRREKKAMPLASPPDHATPQQIEKTEHARAKVMDKVIEKYLVHFEPNLSPVSPLFGPPTSAATALAVDDTSHGDRFAGVRFQRTRTTNGKLESVPGETVDAFSRFVVSSIGSVPSPMPGLPMKGELIDFEDWTTGRVRGLHNVFGLGNALTGKGNIKDSRKNAQQISEELVQSYLGLTGERPLERELAELHKVGHEQAKIAVAVAEAQPSLNRERMGKLFDRVRESWARAGYEGDYQAWIRKVTPSGQET